MQILSRCRSHTKYKKNEVPVLDAKAVFASLKSQGRIADKSEEADAKPGVVYVRMKPAVDGGFNDWYKSHWLPRVLGYDHDAHMGTDEAEQESPFKKFDLKAPVFKVFEKLRIVQPAVPSMA